jgi:hypothetical protein
MAFGIVIVPEGVLGAPGGLLVEATGIVKPTVPVAELVPREEKEPKPETPFHVFRIAT